MLDVYVILCSPFSCASHQASKKRKAAPAGEQTKAKKAKGPGAAKATAPPLQPARDPVPQAECQDTAPAAAGQSTTPPASPRKSSRDPNNPWPTMSPDRQCKHHRYELFQEWNGGYYTAKRLELYKGDAIPRCCAGVCKKMFVTGKYPGFHADKHYKVTSTNVVKCCPNGIDPEHKCDFGLCGPCYIMHVMGADANKENAQPKRKRVKRSLLSPGEQFAEDGSIIPSL